MKTDEQGQYIELADFIKVIGLATTGGQAKILIRAGVILVDGKIEYIDTQNLVIAAFRQPSSRANDPNSHKHLVQLSMQFEEAVWWMGRKSIGRSMPN